jgi:Ran GTPase-activating protein (RanGAP) involved in mRNA processing and transport
MGAMTKLDISSNALWAEGGKALAAGLKGNQMITELNISSIRLGQNSDYSDDTSGANAIADAIPDMGAMTSLDVSENDLCAEGTRLLAEALKGNQIMMELNISSNDMTDGGMSGVVALADVIPDMGALTSLHVGQNGIPKKELREIIAIAMGMDNMKFLCEVPFKDKTLSELDVSGKNLGTEGALVLAEYLDGNGALAKFIFSGDYSDSKSVTMETNMAVADFSEKGLGASGAIMLSAFLPKCT